ncbi:MAG TPA: riboflavin kinase, partial [Chloroflexota bacterium]|nr:riboflavin kinase [Chloroflexota bacterium]
PAAVSVGTRPTFYGRKRVVEAHLLDFDGDIYGQPLRVHFVRRLRGQERFDSIDALIQQMGRDVQNVRSVLGVRERAPVELDSAKVPLDHG